MPKYEAELSDGRIVEFESDHQPSPDELEQAFKGQLKEGPPADQPQTTAIGTAAREFARGVGPTAAGMAAGVGATSLAAGAFPTAPAWAPVAAGLAVGAGIGMGAQKLEDVAIKALAPKIWEEAQAGQAQHPIAAAAGRITSAAPSFVFNPAQGPRVLASVPALIRGTAEPAQKAAAAGLGISTAVQAGLTAGQTLAGPEHRLPTKGEVLEAALTASLFSEPRLKIAARTFLPRSTKEARAAVQQTEATHAGKEQQATEVHGAVRPQPGEGAGEMPVQGSGERVQPQAQRGVEEETQVLLAEHEKGEPTTVFDIDPETGEVKGTEAIPSKEAQAGGGKTYVLDRNKKFTPRKTAPAPAEAEAPTRETSRVEEPADPVEASERAAIDSGAGENRKVGLPSEVVQTEPTDRNAPFFHEIATVDNQGRIVLNRTQFRQWLSGIPEAQRPQAVASLFAEEGIHSVARKTIPDEDLAGLWNSLTSAEQSLVERSYFGKDRKVARPKYTDSQMGHEYLRRSMQRLMKMDVTEAAELAGQRGHFTQKLLSTIEGVILRVRQMLNTRSSQTLDRMLRNLESNLAAAKGEPPKGNAPGAYHRPVKIRTAEGELVEGDFNGYYDMREVGLGIMASVGRKLPDGSYSHGMLRPGEHIEGEVPSFDEWMATAPAAYARRPLKLPETMERAVQEKYQRAFKVLSSYEGERSYDVLKQLSEQNTFSKPEIANLAKAVLKLGDRGVDYHYFRRSEDQRAWEVRREGEPPEDSWEAMFPRPIATHYNLTTDSIAIPEREVRAWAQQRKDPAEVYLHEYIHGLTSYEIERALKAAEDLEYSGEGRMLIPEKLDPTTAKLLDIFKLAGEHYEKTKGLMPHQKLHKISHKDNPAEYEIAYSLTDPMEFVAQAFSSESFQAFLKQVPYQAERTLWDRVVDIIASLFRIEDKTALDRVLRAGLALGSRRQFESYPQEGLFGTRYRRDVPADVEREGAPAAFARKRGDQGTPEMFGGLSGKGKLSRPETEKATEGLAAREAARWEPITPKATEETARNVLQEARPSFSDFVSQAKIRFGPGLQPGQLRDLWTDSVWKHLMEAPGSELSTMVRTMGLSKRAGLEAPTGESRHIVDPLPSEATTEKVKTEMGMEIERRREVPRLTPEARKAQNFRASVIATVGKELISEAEGGRKPFQRSEIAPEEVVAGKEGVMPAWQDFRPGDTKTPDTLGRALTADARAFGGAKLTKVAGGEKIEVTQRGLPVSVTHRLTAIQDKQSGKVYLVSTYRDGRRGAVLLDPNAPRGTHSPLASVLKRYRVLASARVDEPVQGFKQAFSDLQDFERRFATDAREASERLAGYGPPPKRAEAPAHEDEAIQVRHTPRQEVPGLYQEGRGALAGREPMTDNEARTLAEHIFEESATFEGPDDVKASWSALSEKTNWPVLSGYRKLAQQLQQKMPKASAEELLDALAKQVYETHQASSSFEDFVSRTVAQGSPPPGPAIPTRPETPTVPGAEGIQREVTAPEGRGIPKIGKIPWHGPLTTRQPGPPEMLPPSQQRRIEAQAAAKDPYEPTSPTTYASGQTKSTGKVTVYPKREFPKAETPPAPVKPPEAPGAYFRDLRNTLQEEAAKNVHAVGAMVTRSMTKREISAKRDAADNIANNIGRQAENNIRQATARAPRSVMEQLREEPTRGKPEVLSAANALVQAGAIEAQYRMDAKARAAYNLAVSNDPRFRMAFNMMAHHDLQIRKKGIQLLKHAKQDTLNHLIQAGLVSTKNLTYKVNDATRDRLHDFLGMIANGEAKAQQLLRTTRNLIERRQARKWLEAAQNLRKEVVYAMGHWGDGDLRDTATRMKAELDNQYAQEIASGANLRYDQQYLPGRYDAEFFSDSAISFGGVRILGRNYRKPATFETYYDAIEAGPYVPVTRDGAAIVGHRVRQGQHSIQYKGWVDSLFRITDPETGKYVATKAKKLASGGFGEASPDHVLMTLRQGQEPISVRKGYEDLIDDLTSSSKIRNNLLLRGTVEWGQRLKHTILLGDIFHLARLGYYATSILGPRGLVQGHRAGLTALEYRPEMLPEAVSKGLVTQAEADYVTAPVTITVGGTPKTVSRWKLVREFQKEGLNVGRIQDALYMHLVENVPGLGRYNKWLFDRFTRGLMMQSALHSFERLNKAHPNVDARKLMRDVARDVNNYYGSLGRQGLIKSATLQDLSRIVFLAPQWVEGLVMKEAGFAHRATGLAALTGGRKGLPYLGVMGEGIGRGLVAMVALTQAINLITRRQPTWKNEEKEHRFDAYIPSWDPNGKGFFFSPLAVFNELSHDLVRLYETKPKAWDALVQIGENKLSPWGRMAIVLKESRSPGSGSRITTTGGVLGSAAAQLAPTPISFGTVGQAVLSPLTGGAIPPPVPGALQRQAAASFGGIKIEPAASAAQEIGRQAAAWAKANGVDKTTGWTQIPTDEASYSKLRASLRRGNMRGAQSLLAELRKAHSDVDIMKAMRQWLTRPLAGSKRNEREFLYGLDDAGLELYSKAQQERQDEYQKFLDWFLNQP